MTTPLPPPTGTRCGLGRLDWGDLKGNIESVVHVNKYACIYALYVMCMCAFAYLDMKEYMRVCIYHIYIYICIFFIYILKTYIYYLYV